LAKAAKKVRGKFSDEKYLGTEPDLRGTPSNTDIINAYNWYNYFYSSDDAKEFVIAYLKEIKYDRNTIKRLHSVDASQFNTLGWNCRILHLGGVVPEDIRERAFAKIKALSEAAVEPKEDTSVQQVITAPVVSIQERVAAKTSDLIGEIEGGVDEFIRTGKSSFKIADFLRDHEVKPQIASRIAEYYKPLYAELYDALEGHIVDLKEGYSHLRKPKLREYMEFIREIVSVCEMRTQTAKVIRKPRKKKQKSPAQLISKLKYKEKDDTLNVVSVSPTTIIGANQLWVYNTKNRALSVYNAMGPSGLNIKGTTIIGYDEKTSVTKMLRKPENHVPNVVTAGKVAIRKIMDNLKTKPKPANGRINAETVLLRVIK